MGEGTLFSPTNVALIQRLVTAMLALLPHLEKPVQDAVGGEKASNIAAGQFPTPTNLACFFQISVPPPPSRFSGSVGRSPCLPGWGWWLGGGGDRARPGVISCGDSARVGSGLAIRSHLRRGFTSHPGPAFAAPPCGLWVWPVDPTLHVLQCCSGGSPGGGGPGGCPLPIPASDRVGSHSRPPCSSGTVPRPCLHV